MAEETTKFADLSLEDMDTALMVASNEHDARKEKLRAMKWHRDKKHAELEAEKQLAEMSPHVRDAVVKRAQAIGSAGGIASKEAVKGLAGAK